VIYAIIAAIGISGISFFIIKNLVAKNRSLQFKLDFADKQTDSMQENINNYRIIIEKLNNREVESDRIKKNISNASGVALCELANSL